MSDEVSYFSRFFVKFVEIIAAGLATAVSGYLIAHLGGLLSSPLPAAVQVAPTASEVSSLPAQPVPPGAAAADEQRLAPQQDGDPPARKTVKATNAAPARKHIKIDTSVAQGKPRGEESLEARVRAALADIEAKRPALPNLPPHQADVPPRQAEVRAEPRSLDGPPGAADVTLAPRATHVQQPAQRAPAQPGPLTPVDIEPRPVAAVEALPAVPAAPLEIVAAQPTPPAEEQKGVFTALKRIPDLLRPEAPEPVGDAPRPPMPIGQ